MSSELRRRKMPFSARLVMFLMRHIQNAISSLSELWAQPLSALMTIAVLGVSLSLPAGLYVLSKNANSIVSQWDNPAQISVFLQQNLSKQEVDSLQARLKAYPEINHIEYINKEQALEEFKQYSGFGESITYLQENPLPSVIVVSPTQRFSFIDGAQELQDKLLQEPEVTLARLDLEWLTRLQSLMVVVNQGMYSVTTLLLVAVILVIGNSIRLAIMSRRSEIEVMKLVGATNSFIRRPFLYSGVWYGLFGGLIAWLLINVLVLFLEGGISRLFELYDYQISIQALNFADFVYILAAAACLGWLGAYLSVRHHLQQIEPS